MALAETQQLRMLERLRSAGEQPVTLDQLRAGGIDFPAVVIGELELNGYVIERVYEHGRQIGVRLLESGPRRKSAAPRRPSQPLSWADARSFAVGRCATRPPANVPPLSRPPASLARAGR
jgi:hypothetical protein